MMDDAQRHKFDVVLVWACDRLARSTRNFLEIVDELSKLGIEFVGQDVHHLLVVAVGESRFERTIVASILNLRGSPNSG